MGFQLLKRRCARRRRVARVVLGAALTAASLATSASAASHGVLAWGYNETGALGNGTTKSSSTAVATSGLGHGVKAIAAGSFHSLALLRDGTVMAWGTNVRGQLGDGTATGPEKCAFEAACSTTPVLVGGLSGVVAVAGGEEHSIALLSNGTVMAWGANDVGELGNGTSEGSDVPVEVKGLSSVTAISAGSSHNLALLSDGRVMAWGWNLDGQLGDGTTTNRDVPVEVKGLSGVTAIAAGFEHSLALLGNGTVVAWGANGSGQLGDGTSSGPEDCSTTASPAPCSTTPVAVNSLSGVTAVAAGAGHSVALLGSGAVMAWGENNDGQLGDGGTSNSDVPVSVVGLSGVSSVAAGGNHNLALLGEGAVRAWGDNSGGELGDGSTMNSSVPVPVSEVSGVSEIAAGDYHSLAYSPPPPTVTSISPHEGPRAGGTSVTITGFEFTGATQVKFGSIAATGFKVESDTRISAVAPAGSGTVDLTVVSTVGESATGEADRYTYVKTLAEGLPELGRCVKMAGKGVYTRANCLQLSSTHTGSYEWLEGPSSRSAFRGPIASASLQAASGALITCSAGEFSGGFRSAKAQTLNLALSGCREGTRSCSSNATKPGEISTSQALEGELGSIRGGAFPQAGYVYRPEGALATVFSFECREGAEAPTRVVVEGSVIARWQPLDAMRSAFKLTFKARGANQVPERFEGGAPDTLSVTFTSLTGKTGPEEASLTMLGAGTSYLVATNEERLEIKAKV